MPGDFLPAEQHGNGPVVVQPTQKDTPGPNSGDEANLAKWGWPSPALLKRHAPKEPYTAWKPTPEQQECPF